MAAKLGLEIYEWVNKFARKLAAKPDKTGIMQIPNQETVRNLSNDILTKFMKHNVPREALNSENDIKVIYNQIKNIENQALQHRVISPGDPRHKEITESLFGKKPADVLDLSGKKIPPHTQIMGGEEVIVDVVSDTVTNMKKMTPMDAMKEANLVIGRKGKYKNLTIDESQDILKKTNDHIFERDIKYDEFGEIIKPDPEDLADGGVAGLLGERDGYYKGSMAKSRPKKKFRFSPPWMGPSIHQREESHQVPDRVGAQGHGVNFPYKSLEDIPPDVLAMLMKDPVFDLETFLKKVAWSDPDKTRIQKRRKGKEEPPWGAADRYGNMLLYKQKFGKGEPIAGGALTLKSPTDADKVQTILHEMRHAKMREPWFWKSSAIPKYVRETEDPHYSFQKYGDRDDDPNKFVGGEELYIRYLDQLFGDVSEKGTIAGSDYKPYFDKILREEWAPHAKAYKEILEEEKRVKSKPYGLAGGGVAGMLGERTGYKDAKIVEGPDKYSPKNFYGLGLGPLLDEFMSEGRLRDEEGFHTTLNKNDLINLWNYLKEDQDIDLEDKLMFRFGRFNPEEESKFHIGIGKDQKEIGFKKKIDFNKLLMGKAGGGVAGMLGEPTYQDEDHRVPYKDGTKFDPKRRGFLKLAAGLASIPLIGKYFKWAKPLAKSSKVLTSVPIKSGVEGMPVWFKPLVNKVIKEGTEVSSGAERVIVHKTKLPNSKTDVYVEQSLDTGNVSVDIGSGKHGFSDGHLGQPVRLEYKAGEWIEPTIKKGKSTKGTKTKEEFWVEEAEFTGGHPENVKFEESAFEKFGEHGSNFDEVEKFATGKIKKKTTKESIKAERAHWTPEGDYASGGRVPLGGGYLAGGAKSLGKKYKGSTLAAILENPKLLGAELGHDGIMELMHLFGMFSEGGRVPLGGGGLLNLWKLLRGGKTVWRGSSTGHGIGGNFVPESQKFLKGKFYTTDKKLAEYYASLGKGILKIKKKTLTKKELEKAKRIGRYFHEEIILPKKLAKEAEIDIPSSIKVNIKKFIKNLNEPLAEGGRVPLAGGTRSREEWLKILKEDLKREFDKQRDPFPKPGDKEFKDMELKLEQIFAKDRLKSATGGRVSLSNGGVAGMLGE